MTGFLKRNFGESLKTLQQMGAKAERWPPAEYFSGLKIPSDWGSVTEFAQWYMNSGMPWMIPWDAEVICTDDATALCLFRKGRWMVELYLIHPNMAVPTHSHPGMESVIIRLGAGNLGTRDIKTGTSSFWGSMTPVLHSGEEHGGRPLGFSDKGYALLTFEQWPVGVTPTSAAILWKGTTAGTTHDELILKHTPEALVQPGVADCTKVVMEAPQGGSSDPIDGVEFLPCVIL
jgi:hypothetical protein